MNSEENAELDSENQESAEWDTDQWKEVSKNVDVKP